MSDDTNLRISLASHTSVVDVCRTNYHNLIVDNHQLGVNVDNFCYGCTLLSQSSMCSQAQKLYVLFPAILSQFSLKLAQHRVPPATDGLILPVEVELHNGGTVIVDLACKARQ